jgi:glycosyltransferase involved in cell wall biosynthesis
VNILYSHHSFCMQRHGGVSRYFTELFRRIPACGGTASTRVVAPLFDNEYLSRAKRAPETPQGAILGVELPTLPGPRIPRRAANALLAQLIGRRQRGVDIFHQTYFSTHDYAPASARRILTVFDMIHELYPGDFLASDSTREAKRASVARADHVICISHATCSDLVRLLGVAPSKLSVVHLAGGLGNSAAPHALACSESSRPFLLYVGRREGYKNFRALLSELGGTPALRDRVDLACFGGGELTAAERADVAGAGLRKDQVVCHAGDDRSLAALYARASALVYPSLYEGFGIPPLEAMAAGCPVVCAATSSLPEVVGDAAEWFEPGVPGALAAALLRVLDDPTRRDELVARGLHRSQAFSWDRCARETLAVYREVLAR